MQHGSPFPPQAYLIGAQKAGTTSLAYLLQQHPCVRLSNPKETHFLSVQFELGLDWYRSKFEFAEGQILLDASTSYTMANLDPSCPKGIRVDVPSRIHALRPDAKLIYILRDPVERTVSAYWHNVRFASERRTLREAVQDDPVYLWASLYHRQMQRYLQHFDRSAILVLDFRELRRDPAAVAQKAVEFLGLCGAEVDFHLDEPKNRGFQFTAFGRTLRRMFGDDAAFVRTARWARSITPVSMYRLARRALIADPHPVAATDRDWLREFFKDDVENIERLTGLRLLDGEV